MSKQRPGRAPPLLRGRRCAPDRRIRLGQRLPFSNGQSLRPRWNIPPAGVTFTKPQRRFTHVRPSRPSPRLWPPGGTGALGLLPRASHPAVTRDARQGGDGPPRTGPSTAPTALAEPHTVPPTSLKRPHVARSHWSPPSPPASTPSSTSRFASSHNDGTIVECVDTSCTRRSRRRPGSRTQHTTSALPMSNAATRSMICSSSLDSDEHPASPPSCRRRLDGGVSTSTA